MDLEKANGLAKLPLNGWEISLLVSGIFFLTVSFISMKHFVECIIYMFIGVFASYFFLLTFLERRSFEYKRLQQIKFAEETYQLANDNVYSMEFAEKIVEQRWKNICKMYGLGYKKEGWKIPG